MINNLWLLRIIDGYIFKLLPEHLVRISILLLWCHFVNYLTMNVLMFIMIQNIYRLINIMKKTFNLSRNLRKDLKDMKSHLQHQKDHMIQGMISMRNILRETNLENRMPYKINSQNIWNNKNNSLLKKWKHQLRMHNLSNLKKSLYKNSKIEFINYKNNK